MEGVTQKQLFMLITAHQIVVCDKVFLCLQESNRSGRTKEDIQMMNLKKKTRKRTRKFEIDGVVVTTTTSKVIYGDEENGKVYDDHIFRQNSFTLILISDNKTVQKLLSEVMVL